eukprot:361647-Chlamydomonas_euryale.AAC.2
MQAWRTSVGQMRRVLQGSDHSHLVRCTLSKREIIARAGSQPLASVASPPIPPFPESMGSSVTWRGRILVGLRSSPCPA